MKTAFRVVSVLMIALVGSAAEMEPVVVARALDAVEREARKDWAYTMTVLEDGEKRVERFDPSGEPGREWTLVLIDGRKPTEDDLEDYEKTRERRKKSDNGASVREMIRPGTLKLVRENGRRAIYSFEVRGRDEKDQKMMDHVEAWLHVDTSEGRVERLELKSAEAFSPFPGVKIDSFEMKIDYVALKNGPVAPDRIETKVRGKAFLIKTIDSDVEVTFGEYRRVGSRR